MITLPTLNKSTSPWQDPSLENLFRTELSLVSDPIDLPMYKSLTAFQWIHKTKTAGLLFRGLTKFAPLYPVNAYKGEISSWLSPPPSGSGNTVLLIIGKDQKGKARLVGTNYLNMPQCNNNFTVINFFEDYDKATSRTKKESLIYNMISSQMTLDDLRNAKQVTFQAEVVRTMPIALLVLDVTKSYMAFSPAVVCGNHPSDMSLEFLGEVL
jgi:hypothetical protein